MGLPMVLCMGIRHMVDSQVSLRLESLSSILNDHKHCINWLSLHQLDSWGTLGGELTFDLRHGDDPNHWCT